jgi:very-short-patch-repair endonuclease
VTPDGIKHRIRRGRLAELYPGVYRVGQLPLSETGRLVAAVLACGEGAILSHESAAVLWRMRKPRGPQIDVSVPQSRRIRLPGIRVHRRSPMPPATNLGPLPLTKPLFTLIDLAASLPRDLLEAAINEADKLGLLDWETLRSELENPGLPHYPGIGKLRKTIDRYTRTDSNLERRFLALLRQANLPLPETQQHLGPGRIDFYWPELNLVVETDGLTYHRTPMQQLADRQRDQQHTLEGRTQLRFPNIQIRHSSDEVVQVLRPVMERLKPAERGKPPRR